MKVENELGHLMINGLGSSNGGHFDSAVINGKGTVNGDMDCNTFSCNGAVTVNGNVKAEKMKISGTTKIQEKFMQILYRLMVEVPSKVMFFLTK